VERVAIYNRCSTEEESQVSALLVQAQESREIAIAKGWEIAEQYVESQSGTTASGRPEYQRMMADIEAEDFDIVMIKSIDRLARNAKDWYIFLDSITRHGIRLYLYLEQKFYVPEDALVTGIKAILAEQFSKDLSQKIRNAHRRRQQKQSGFNITRQMYGFQRIRKDVYEIDEAEAAYIRMAFRLAVQGYGYRRISNFLYDQGARTRDGGRISEAQWRNMLLSPRMHGTVVLHTSEYDFETKKRKKIPEEEWIYVEHALPAIVDKDYQRDVIKRLEQRTRQGVRDSSDKNDSDGLRRRGCRHQYELSGKLICACCGSVYYRTTSSYSWGSQIDWKCSSYVKTGCKKAGSGEGCTNIKIEENALLNLLMQTCGRVSAGGEDLGERILSAAENVLKQMFESADYQREEEQIRKLIAKKNRELDLLLRKLLDGVLRDEEYQKYDRKAHRELEELSGRLESLATDRKKQQKQSERVPDIVAKIRQNQWMEQAWVRGQLCHFDRILVHPDGRLVFLPKEPQRLYGSERFSQTEIFYRRITKGEQNRARQREEVYDCMCKDPYVSVAEIMRRLDMKESTVYNRVKELRQSGRVCYKREGRGGYWLITDRGDSD